MSAPAAVYGGPVGDAAYQARQAKILASKAKTADKGAALRLAKAQAAAEGKPWSPDIGKVEAAHPLETAPAGQDGGAVYGGPKGDAAYQARQAKILASKAKTADKGAALRLAKAEAAAKGEKWNPEAGKVEAEAVAVEEMPAGHAPGTVYGGPKGDAAWQARQAKIMESNAKTADKGAALRLSKVEAAAKGEAWKPNV
eukprot:CAMPEP_0172526180 /NCGR_PEP_ID=MMETSP1067-20121228/1146_1 /TAXON_ID=265564 ORGANISM="Thalassiosira punctigera, Strain Tpunct2005C2" /NCGR_SAMPLE_ID=MMETSP1067 /ASSEMBLY_ACC=CAM_ASM_000444 /LENGTH=197 /DNA_ID=CAMNT_0013309629 /DNA_START=90 /DNA_END=683 /DNA_ORIENTATION=-